MRHFFPIKTRLCTNFEAALTWLPRWHRYVFVQQVSVLVKCPAGTVNHIDRKPISQHELKQKGCHHKAPLSKARLVNRGIACPPTHRNRRVCADRRRPRHKADLPHTWVVLPWRPIRCPQQHCVGEINAGSVTVARLVVARLGSSHERSFC